ncbi:HD-GYP domain-containing protein [Sphingopyxis sp.]|uniref:HD-GYP domain-containing protein n=1 Tax=Sphingopyxis sp. TaxID=1908224 RepID=UPI003D147B2A
MLVRIRPEDAEIGMFVHGFDGSWFDHPFWRRNFRLETSEQLLRIRNSAIEALVIDRSRSVVADAASVSQDNGNASPVALIEDEPAPRRQPISFGPPPSTEREELRRRPGYGPECRRAKRAIERSKQAVATMFEDARLGRAVEARRMVPLARAIGQSIERDARALINLVRLKEKDEYTYLHSVAVAALMMNFGRHLGLEDPVIEDLGVAGLLHDVGKVAVAEDILNKPGGLSDGEMRSVRGHPLAGHRLLENSSGVPEAALEVCLRHHEKMDGAGYPGGLRGEALSLFARMGAICDVYDAVTSDRPYKRRWTPCEALTEMQGWDGHFDPALLDRFADSLGIYPVGTLVRLSTGELGIVMGSDGDAYENVVVRAFFDCETLMECEPRDRPIAPSAENPRIVGRDSPTFWRFPDWDATRLRVMAAKPA